MGIGPPVLALYRQLKQLGLLEGIHEVMDMGAQNVWCPKPGLVRNLFDAFGKPTPPQDMLERFANWKGSARELYTALGFEFACVDVDPSFDSIRLDLNFDSCPVEHRGRYGFVTNHGTSEHLLNQYNFFKVVHDLTRPGGIMLHAVPFTVHLEHGFFNYQPNFFDALARYNAYSVHGVLVGPDWQLSSLVPWEPALMDFLSLNSKTSHLLLVVLQKLHDREFCVPFQGVYEKMVPEEVMGRYNLVVDGELYDGKRVRHIAKEQVIADQIAHETLVLRNEFASLNGKYWDLTTKHAAVEQELAAARQDAAARREDLGTSMLATQVLQGKHAALEQELAAARQDAVALQGRIAALQPRAVLNGVRGVELVRELSRRILRRLFG